MAMHQRMMAWRYHKDNAPNGVLMDVGAQGQDEKLAAEGWTDDPSKLGIDPWYNDGERFGTLKATVESGEVPRIGEFDRSPFVNFHKDANYHGENAQLAAYAERVRQLETENAALRQAREELGDEQADADRETDRADRSDQARGTLASRTRHEAAIESGRRDREGGEAPAAEPPATEPEGGEAGSGASGSEADTNL